MKNIKKNHIMTFVSMVLILSIFIGCGSQKHVATTQKQEVVEVDQVSFDYTFIEANKQKILGNIPVAQSLYLKCLEYKPKSAAVNYQLARLQILKGDINGALLYAEKTVELDSTNLWYHKLLLTIYQSNKQEDKLYSTLNRLVKLYPKNIQMKMEFINSLIKQKEFDKALKICNELESQVGISEDISFLKKQIFVENSDYESAYKTIKDIILTFPKKFYYYGVLAELYNSNEELFKAEETYMKLIDLKPDYGLGYLGLAELLISQGKVDEALNYYEKGYRCSDTEFSVKLNSFLALINYMKIEDNFSEKAEKLVDVLFEEYPTEYHLYLLKTDYCIERNDFNCAKGLLLKVIEEKSEFTIWQQLLYSFVQLQEFDNLIKYCDKALESFPTQSTIYFFKGLGLHQLGENEKALTVLQKSLRYVSKNIDLKINIKSVIGDVYFDLNQYENMYAEYDDVLIIDPDNTGVLNNYSYYLSLQNKNLEKAEIMSKKCLDKEPNNPTFLDTYAWILFKLGRYNEAKINIEKAIKNDTENNSVLVEHYGDILFKSDSKELALKNWIKASKINNSSDETLKRKIKYKKYIERIHKMNDLKK